MAGRVNVLQGTSDEDLPVLAATDKVRRELLERHQAAGARRMECRRALRRQRNDGRKRSGVGCRGRDLAATLRYRSTPRPPGEGSTTGTAHRALNLEPRRFRYAYRTGHAARRGDVTRSIENRMDTITSMAQAREDAPFSLRTSRTTSFLITHQAHPSYGHETQSTTMARRRPRIDVRVLGNVVAWPPEPRFPAAGSRKKSLVRNQDILCLSLGALRHQPDCNARDERMSRSRPFRDT